MSLRQTPINREIMASNDETNLVSDNIRSDKLKHSQSNRRKKKQDTGKNSGNNVNRIGTMEFLKINVNNSKKDKITIDSIPKSDIWLKHDNGKTKLNMGVADDKINEVLTKNSEDEKNDIKIEKINRYNSSLNKKIIAFPLILILIQYLRTICPHEIAPPNHA